ncbi:MAG: DUF4321 domain-containing protein [Clostridiales bacterium]|nr:DUF4321 domain-containing protein [Clostridiales bacterium]
MERSKNFFLLLFFVLAALVIGGLVGELTAGIPWLRWLTYGQSIGFNGDGGGPLVDLQMIQINFGFRMQVSVLQIILITAALLIYRKVR